MIPSDIRIDRPSARTVSVALSGEWKVGNALPSVENLLTDVSESATVSFDTTRLDGWDSVLLVFIRDLADACRRRGVAVDQSGLPAGVRKLIDLASPEKQRSGMTREKGHPSFLVRVADRTFDQARGIRETVSFIGEVTLGFVKLVKGRPGFRGADFLLIVQEAGAQALPIVTLISLLVGMILAFIAAIQLKLFGAQIYVADVVGIGIVRVMGAVMAGIIMAGRTGAAFAAQLGTMQVNEEIDALESLGVSPVDFLVLPRVLALTLMMPLLCVYADLMGMVGGLAVGVGILELGVAEYLNESKSSLTLAHFLVGLFHSFVFGILVALSGCLRGMQCVRSASAVGYAATSAVVTSIVAMVLATLIITLCCQVLGI